MNKCDKCGSDTNGKLFKTFGKNVCLFCINKSKRDGVVGNSGMVYNKDIIPDDYYDMFLTGITLVKVQKSHPLFVKWYFEHYSKSRGIVGRQLNYLIYYNTLPVGIISATSPPLNYIKFRDYFNKANEKMYVNNSAFRIVTSPEKNFGTKVLKLFRITIKKDYKKFYGDDLIGIVTFVEKPRTGSVYLADNWNLLGETQGIEVRRRGEDWINKQYSKTDNKKLIFAYKYKSGRLNCKCQTSSKS